MLGGYSHREPESENCNLHEDNNFKVNANQWHVHYKIKQSKALSGALDVFNENGKSSKDPATGSEGCWLYLLPVFVAASEPSWVAAAALGAIEDPDCKLAVATVAELHDPSFAQIVFLRKECPARGQE